MPFTFVHTADWQLGKQFANIDGDAGAALRNRRIEAVRAVGELATERRADAILVAGDTFDHNAVADRTVIQMLDALKEFAGDWVFIPGNHDPALADSAWTRLNHFGPPDNVHLALEPEEPLLLGDGRACVLPAVLERRHEIDDLTAWFDRAETRDGAIRVGLAHGSVQEFLPGASESPNPVAASRAESARLDYLALGDWHGTLRVDDRTWYSGTPEADRYQSSDPGNALVVTIGESGAPPDVEKVRTGHFAWRTAAMEIRNASDVEAMDRTIAELGPEPGRLLLKLRLEGAIDLAARAGLLARLEYWGALLHHLAIEDTLMNEPSDNDLDRIDRSGFVRTAVERLRERARDETDAESEAAAMALIRLYEIHVGAEG